MPEKIISQGEDAHLVIWQLAKLFGKKLTVTEDNIIITFSKYNGVIYIIDFEVKQEN